MNYNNYGYFFFEFNDEQIKIVNKVNSIHFDSKIIVENGILEYANFVLIFDEQSIKVMRICNLTLNGINQEKQVFNISESDVISTDCFSIKLLFMPYDDSCLEKLIDLFLEGTLPEFFDVSRLFINYAVTHKISDKQVAFILASIDIPELEEN